MQFQAHGAAHPGQIGDRAHRVGVNPGRTPMTEGTVRLFGDGGHHDSDGSVRGIEEL